MAKLLTPWFLEASPMFQPWRFKLKEAETAAEQGRLADAAKILTTGDMPTYLPAQQLLSDVAGKMAQRAAETAKGGDFEAAWKELAEAKRLTGQTATFTLAQQKVAEAALGQVVLLLKAGDYEGSLVYLDRLSRRDLPAASTARMREVIRRLDSARKLASRGKFGEADEQLSAALALRRDLEFIETQREQVRFRGERSRQLQEALHRALATPDYSEALKLADQLLELAPENRVARDARRRAWAQVGAKVGESHNLSETQHWPAAIASGKAATEQPHDEKRRQPRFMLWIDAVGGYLVCLNSQVVIGQAHPGTRVEVPLQADISRRHAMIRREGEGYVVQPLGGSVKIDGKPIDGPALLSDGDELELGDGVRLRFRRPHVLSSSARLDILSRHRTQPFVDGVILMAESCVLGPKWQNHVVCRDWTGDVVLYRNDDKLFCRAMESLEIDGKLHDGRGKLGPNSRVVGSDFSLSLELLS
ncbi:MAG TPA: FHA domain-containing protein [Pirellulaceae bacterium]|nr:FHA domain-containing protein [Pirellulaceae bacterium]